MLETKAYRRFMQGRYFSEGIRMTAGIALPAFILGYFGLLDIGIIIATGALCVSVTDSAGPVHHRANGMFICTLIIGIVSILTNFCLASEIITAVEILVLSFAFSMLSVYNARVSSIGISALLIMVLCMQSPLTGNDIFLHAMYLVIGGTWYMLFSLALHTLRPYKLIQQLSGEFISGVGEYLRSRASFYDDHPDYEATYRSLLQQQVKIQTQQSALSELLFKTRAITKNSTRAGRSLLKIYLDVADLFESIMSVYQQYEVLHKRFDETGILEEYRVQLIGLSDELVDIAHAVAAGKASVQTGFNKERLTDIRAKFELLRQNFMTEKNLADFIGLGRIFNNIRDLTNKIDGLHYYTRYDKAQRPETLSETDLQKFNEAQTIDPALFINNLNIGSGIFRHSLRVAISLLIGYLISLFFHIGHSYWILLTILVILKPAYSLSKSRNKDRLLGSIAGILIGVGILFAVKAKLALLIIMVIFMAGGYMFIRTRYFISVLLMTVYLVIFFHLIYPSSITEVLFDRVLDTAIGSAIAFVSSLFFVPSWEHMTINVLMKTALEKNIAWYKCLSKHFIEEIASDPAGLKKARQSALTALANVSDALTRMLSEPKRFQKRTEDIYRFVVLNHILTSHFAALAFYLDEEKQVFRSTTFSPLVAQTITNLESAAVLLSDPGSAPDETKTGILQTVAEETESLLEQRKNEIAAGELETDTKKKLIAAKSVSDQFIYIYRLSSDVLKNISQYNKEH